MPPGMAEAQAAAAEAGAMVPGSRKRKQCPSKNCGCPAQKQPCFGLPGGPCRLPARRLCALLGLTCLRQTAGLYQHSIRLCSLGTRLLCVSCTHLLPIGTGRELSDRQSLLLLLRCQCCQCHSVTVMG